MGWIADVFRRQAAAGGARPALTCLDETLSYATMHERSSRVAQALLAEGLKPQDRVAFLDRNSSEGLDVLIGCSKANLVPVPLNWRLSTPELAYVIADAGARLLFVGPDFVPQMQGIAPELRTVEQIIAFGPDQPYPHFEGWLGRLPDVDPHAPEAEGDVAVIFYTSGTTGRPKGVMITSANLAASLAPKGPLWGFERDSVVLLLSPLFHVGGCGYGLVAWYLGCHVVMPRAAEAGTILASIDRHRVTDGFFVPAILQAILAHPDSQHRDLSSLRGLLYGGSPITPELLMRALQTLHCNYLGSYGLTESTASVSNLPPEDHDVGGPNAHRLQSVGRPFPWVRFRVVDPETTADLPVGTVGEVWIQSEGVMKGYWGLPEETARTIMENGWLRTGDAGYLDGDGYLYLVDRIKDMIISGGENIYPTEVENVLAEHPAVSAVAVIGVPDERWGETVKAIVVAVPGVAVTAEEIIAFARERLAHYKCPSSVDFVPALPTNASGKVQKRELREPFWRGLASRIH